MTEKEKMLAGKIYDANNDLTLIAERERAKEICFDLNALRPAATRQRQELIRALFGKTAANFTVTPPFWCDYGYNISVGDNFYVNHNCVILDAAKVTFGNNVFIGPDCGFYTAEHPLDADERNRGLEYALPITVGDNVWIGAGTRVLAGVVIGSGSVVGAGSVVTKNIPDNVVAFGNPCRVVRPITAAEK